MNLFQRIGNAIMSFGTNDVEPWLKSFFTSVVHAEADALIPIATAAVNAELSGLSTATSTGDWAAFAASQANVVTATAKAAQDASIKVGVASLTTAVTAVISAHPEINP